MKIFIIIITFSQLGKKIKILRKTNIVYQRHIRLMCVLIFIIFVIYDQDLKKSGGTKYRMSFGVVCVYYRI